MLQRHIKVLDSLRRFCDRREKSVRDMRRIGIHNTDPLELVYFTKRTDQRRKCVDFAEILAVTRRVLRDQHDFFYALVCKISGLFNDRAKSSRSERSSH